MKQNKTVRSMLLIALIWVSCSRASEAGMTGDDQPVKPDLSGSPIRQLASGSFPDGSVSIGVATHYRLFGTGSLAVLDREFAYATPANDFKQSAIHPRPGQWDWSQADAWVKQARENGQVIRMHAPISPQCSNWVRDDSRTPAELEQMLDEYMTALCLHYNGVDPIRWLDVVNETLNADGTWFGPKEGTDKWENPWTIIGFDESDPLRPPLYIGKACELANRYGSNLKLIINQHGAFEAPAWDKMKELVQYLQKRGLRVDGLGWQAHIDLGWEKIPGNIERLAAMVDWCQQRGMEFHITEFNVWLKPGNEKKYAQQADTFTAVAKVLLDRHKTGSVGINFWQVRPADGQNESWDGCLFTNDFQLKPAVDALKQLIQTYKPSI